MRASTPQPAPCTVQGHDIYDKKSRRARQREDVCLLDLCIDHSRVSALLVAIPALTCSFPVPTDGRYSSFIQRGLTDMRESRFTTEQIGGGIKQIKAEMEVTDLA